MSKDLKSLVFTAVVAVVCCEVLASHRDKRQLPQLPQLPPGFDLSDFLRPEPGPAVEATQGQVWPKPQRHITLDGFMIVRPNVFRFKVVNETCDILEAALDRYLSTLRKQDKTRRVKKTLVRSLQKRRHLRKDEGSNGNLDQLEVDLRAPCEDMPYLHMDEHYELRINSHDLPQAGLLTSQSVWGILRGLETWSQLLYTPPGSAALIINSTSIMDFPRFPHRGLLLDTSRHFMPVRTILDLLEAMEMNKMNVFHWHIVDDQSFPYQSLVYPELSDKGAYSPAHVYSPDDVKDVIQNARQRGIRVIPEFDSPGHTRSWGEGYPQLLTKCYENSKPDGTLGPMNPISEDVYDFVQTLFKEVNDVFPDEYLHLGGDEVSFDCWEGNPELSAYMRDNNLTTTQLEEVYIRRVIDLVTEMSIKSIVWQEVFDNGVDIQKDTIVQVWKGGDYMGEMADVTARGYKALLSSCWYLDSLSSGGDWAKFYDCDPEFFEGSDAQRKLVLGGETCMWAEVVNVNNVLSRIWPRASAAAEKLWSAADVDDRDDAARRLEEHVCRMNRRGIPAQPANGPGFCPDVNFQ